MTDHHPIWAALKPEAAHGICTKRVPGFPAHWTPCVLPAGHDGNCARPTVDRRILRRLRLQAVQKRAQAHRLLAEAADLEARALEGEEAPLLPYRGLSEEIDPPTPTPVTSEP